MSMTIIRNGVPIILIDKHIGFDEAYGNGIMGNEFVKELNTIENSNYDKCEVWINSVGGSVMDGMDIFNAIQSSNIEVNTRCTGIAASISGIIFQAGKNRIMNDYSLLMIHNPTGSSNDEALNSIKDSLITMLGNKSGKATEDISNMMDKETWLDSSECLDMGFCDAIEVTHLVENTVIENKSPFKLYNELRMVHNKLVENKTEKKMLKVLNALNLAEDSAEDLVLKEVNSLKEQIETLTNSVNEKEAILVAEKEAKELAEKDGLALELVENAIESKRLDSNLKESFVNLAKSDFEGTKNALEAMPVVVEAKKLPMSNNSPEGRTDWTYDKWQKEDSKGLINMLKNSPEEYNLLLNRWKESK